MDGGLITIKERDDITNKLSRFRIKRKELYRAALTVAAVSENGKIAYGEYDDGYYADTTEVFVELDARHRELIEACRDRYHISASNVVLSAVYYFMDNSDKCEELLREKERQMFYLLSLDNRFRVAYMQGFELIEQAIAAGRVVHGWTL